MDSKETDIPIESSLPSDPYTLSDYIDAAKQKIVITLELKGKKEHEALVKLESLVIQIGAMIEAEALKSLGFSEPKELETKWLEEFEKKADSFNNLLTWRMKSINKILLEYLRYTNIVKDYPGTYLGAKKTKDIVDLTNKLITTINKDLPEEQKGIAKKNPEFQANYLTLRDAYLSVLKEIRGFGELELEFEDYNNIVDGNVGENSNSKMVKKNLKKKESQTKEAKENIESLKKSIRLLPTSWIQELNHHKLLLLIKTGIDKDKDCLGTFGFETISANKIDFTKLPSTKKLIMLGWGLRTRVLTLREKASEATIIHELGHGVSMINPIIGALEEIYYLKRTTKPSGKRFKVQITENHSMREGDFVNKHMGKDSRDEANRTRKYYEKYNKILSKKDRYRGYGFSKERIKETANKENRRSHYEVFSYGLEAILCGSNGYLAGVFEEKQDVELRYLVLGILAII